MSMDFWVCEGIGVRSSVIWPLLDMSKCREAVKKLIPDEDIPYNNFSLDDYMDGNPFYGLGDFLAQLDDTTTISYGDNGNGETFFIYNRSYPWEHFKNEPDSIDEVHRRIINAISKVCNLSKDEIDLLIEDDIYEEGWG